MIYFCSKTDDRQVHLGRSDFKAYLSLSHKLINRFRSRLNTHTQYADALKIQNSNILMLLSCFYCNLIYFSSSLFILNNDNDGSKYGWDALYAHT